MPHPRAPNSAIALVTDRMDWHARALRRAFAGLGIYTFAIDLSACGIVTDSTTGLMLPGFKRQLPRAVFVRTMSAGSFEAVTLRLGVLHALSALGISIWNNARAIERCVDKSATSFLLARAGVPTPATWAIESPIEAAAIIAHQKGPFVLKPLFGSQGRGLRLIRSTDDLPSPSQIAGGVYYLQRFVGTTHLGSFHDFRVFISARRVVATMIRHSADWITNVKRGGKPLPAVADRVMGELAMAAVEAVGCHYAGVDIVHDADGRPFVLEVNSMPAWSGLQRTTSVDSAKSLASDLISSLSSGERQGWAL